MTEQSVQRDWDENPEKTFEGPNLPNKGHQMSVLGGAGINVAHREHVPAGLVPFSGNHTGNGEAPAQHSFSHEPRHTK